MAEPLRALIVEDSPSVRLYLEALVRKWGFDTSSAADGAEAWELLQSRPIHLLISDWMMPRLSGLELCRRVRAAALPHYVYTILVTARSESADLLEGMSAGADDFLSKPVDARELQVRVEAARRVLLLEMTLEERNRRLSETNAALEQAYRSMRLDVEAAAFDDAPALGHDRLARKQALDAGKRCSPAGGELELQQFVAAFGEHPRLHHSGSDQRLRFGGEGQPRIRLRVIQRLDAERVAGEDQPAGLGRPVPGVVNGDRVHAAQVLDEVGAVLEVQMQRRFAIGPGNENVLAQSRAQLWSVVDLRVGDQRDPAVAVGLHVEGLFAIVRGDDREAGMDDPDIAGEIGPAAIRSPVGDDAGEAFQRRLVRRPSVPGHQAGNPSHQTPLSILAIDARNRPTIRATAVRTPRPPPKLMIAGLVTMSKRR